MNLKCGNDNIAKVIINIEKSIIIVELSNNKKYFNYFKNLENMEQQIIKIATEGEKYE